VGRALRTPACQVATDLYSLQRFTRRAAVPLDRYAKRNEDFVLVTASSSGFEADRIHEFAEIVNDTLVEAIQLRTLLLLQFAVG
jgi:hypothetical protein